MNVWCLLTSTKMTGPFLSKNNNK